MDPEVVPNFEMSFESFEDAFLFYKKYAGRVGFPIKKNRKRGTTGKDFCCSLEWMHNTKVKDGDRKTSKTSKRDGCKAMVCAREARGGGRVFFTRIVFEHNHKLNPTPSMTKRMRAHKVEDPSVMNLVDTMHASQVPHPNVMRVLRSVAGGVENLHLTERDVQNR